MPPKRRARLSTMVRPVKKYNRNVVRKTTRRGAYKKGKKKQFAFRRAPFVETKRKDQEALSQAGFFSGTGEINSNGMLPDRISLQVYDTETLMMDPVTFLLWSQGLDQSQHIGQAVNLKYTNMKIQIRFPQPSVTVESDQGGYETQQEIPQVPTNYELIWGWIPAPLQLTGQTTPAANTVTLDQIRLHINHRVTDYVNSKKDKLRFIPKKDVTIRISGRRKVRPDLRHATSQAQLYNSEDDEVTGTIPDYHTEISFNHKNRKLWLEQTGNINGDSDLIAMYPNYSWLPFCVLVNWNHADLPSDTVFGRKEQCPSAAWNSITYFSDS